MADALLIERDASIAAKFALALWSVATAVSLASVTVPAAADALHMVALVAAAFGAICMAAYLAGIISARNLLDPVMYDIGLKDDIWYANTPAGREAQRRDHYQKMKPPRDDDDPSRKRVRITDLDTADAAWISVRGVEELFIEIDRCHIVLSEVESRVTVLVSGKDVTLGYPAGSLHYIEIFEQNGPVERIEI